jgi:hypothetical protein
MITLVKEDHTKADGMKIHWKTIAKIYKMITKAIELHDWIRMHTIKVIEVVI